MAIFQLHLVLEQSSVRFGESADLIHYPLFPALHHCAEQVLRIRLVNNIVPFHTVQLASQYVDVEMYIVGHQCVALGDVDPYHVDDVGQQKPIGLRTFSSDSVDFGGILGDLERGRLDYEVIVRELLARFRVDHSPGNGHDARRIVNV